MGQQRELVITKLQAEKLRHLNAAVELTLSNVALYTTAIMEGHGIENTQEYSMQRVLQSTQTDPCKLVIVKKEGA